MGAHIGRPPFAVRRPQDAERRTQNAFFASLNRGGGLKGRRGFFY